MDMKPVIDMLQEHNIGPILDYAAESEDSSDDSGDGIEGKSSCQHNLCHTFHPSLKVLFA